MSESDALDPALVAYRAAVPEDVNFILNSWLKSHRKAKIPATMNDRAYFRLWHTLARRIIERALTGRVTVLVACSRECPDQILGWSAYERAKNTLHYVYVKHPYRRWGLARTMLALHGISHEAPAVWTHQTHAADQYLSRYRAGYDPGPAILGDDDDDRAA